MSAAKQPLPKTLGDFVLIKKLLGYVTRVDFIKLYPLQIIIVFKKIFLNTCRK